MKELSILIPAYNEERNIPRLLSDLAEQKLDGAYSVEIIVVVNGSNDATYSIAEQFQDRLKSKGYSVRTVNLAEPGKVNALNHGLLIAKYSLIANIDSDCRILDKDFLSKVLNQIEKKSNLKLVGVLDMPIMENVSIPPLLHTTLRVQQIYRETRGRIMPVGRFMLYDKADIEEFPLGIHSEDTWASLLLAERYGWDSVEVLTDPVIHYYPPKSWEDYMLQETRHDQGYLELINRFPELQKAYKNRLQKRSKTKSQILLEVKNRLAEEGIESKLFEYFDMFWNKIIIENSENGRKLINSDGSWNQVKSTK